MARKPTLDGPQFVRWMPPILECLRALGDSATASEATDWVADKCGVSDEQREELQKNRVKRFYNQVAWAKKYLTWEGLVESSKGGIWTLTERGKVTALTHKESIAIYRKWAAVYAKRKAGQKTEKKDREDSEIGEVEDTVLAVEQTSGEELLEVLRTLTPNGFERICQRLMRESGFERVTVTGRSHDQGIDGIGILLINRFVSFKVLFQCKRYRGSVSRSQVADFRNSMIGRADKGIIITTGTFTSEAIREADRDGAPPVELVDGQKLVKMFEDLELGLKPKTVFEVDHSFFAPFKMDGPKFGSNVLPVRREKSRSRLRQAE